MFKGEIIIAGAGAAGLTTAVLLAEAGLDVTVIEKGPLPDPDTPPEPNGRTAALMQGSLNTLSQAGILAELEEACAPLKKLQIVDGDQSLTFDADEIHLPHFGLNVPLNLLTQLLLKRAKTLPNLTLMDQSEIWDFEIEDQNFLRIRLNDEQEILARLLIGADGKNSDVRAIAGIRTTQVDYHQTAMTCLIDHTKDHMDTSTEFHRTNGPFTLVPCKGLSSAVVWCESHAEAEQFMKMRQSDFTQGLQDRTKGFLGEVSLRTPPESWKLKGLAARRLTSRRLALIAEAAHALHPIGAQGLNLSLRDVQTLNDLIIHHHSLGLDIGQAVLLERYERARRLDVYSRFAGVSAFNFLTAHPSGLITKLRQTGLSLLQRSPRLRQKAMKTGLGLEN
jgi:2-octaprenyl-6-methoxyphenol hydroxylase